MDDRKSTLYSSHDSTGASGVAQLGSFNGAALPQSQPGAGQKRRIILADPPVLPTPAVRPPLQPWLPSSPGLLEQATVQAQDGEESVTKRDERGLRGVWARRGIWMGPLAFMIGALGEVFLLDEAKRSLGGWMQVVAGVLAVLAWSSIRDRPVLTRNLEARKRWKELVTWRRGLALRLVGIAGSLALLVASFFAFWAKPDDFFGLQGALWLASMGLLLLSCARWYPRKSSEPGVEPPWTWAEVALLLSILIAALITHLVWLQQIPWQVEGNEFTSFRESMSFFADPPRTSLFTTVFLGTGMPSMWFAPEGFLMRFVGDTLGGTRVWSALCGALLVIPVYMMTRLCWNRAAATLASIGIAISTVIVHYSRMTLPNIGPTLWWTVCFYFLLRGLRSRRPGDFVWAGLAAGTSMYTYYATRLIPYVLAAFIGYLLVFHFKAFRERIGHFALMLVAFAVGFGPLIAYFMRNPKLWGGRGESSLIIPAAIPTNWEGWVNDWNIVSQQVYQNFLSLSIIPSRDNFYFASFFRPMEGVLMLLGLAILVWRWRQPASFLLLLWFSSVMFVSSIIDTGTNPNPNFSHWSPAWSVFYMALALPPSLWLSSLRRVSVRWSRVGWALLAVGVAWSVYSNAYFYLVTYPPKVWPDIALRAAQGRFIEGVKPNSIVRFVGCCWYMFDREYGWMMAPHLAAGQLLNPSRDLPLVGDSIHDQIFVLNRDQMQYMPIIQSYYPGGQIEPIKVPDGGVVSTAYKLGAAQVSARYGVSAVFTEGGPTGNVVWQGQVSSVGALPDVQLNYPVTGTWSGSFYTPGTGAIQLNVAGGKARVWVMGQSTTLNTLLTPDAGWTPFAVQARLSGPNLLHLMLQQVSGQPSEIGTAYLWPDASNRGLMATINSQPTPMHRIDQFVGAPILQPPGDLFQPGDLPGAPQVFRPLPLSTLFGGGTLIRWAGEVFTDPGSYTMELATESGNRATLQIDHNTVMTTCTNAAAQVQFTSGWHQVQVDYQGGATPRGLEWIWTKPDGVREVVPPSHLRYTNIITPNSEVPWPDLPTPNVCMP